MIHSRRSLFGLALGALAAPFVPARPQQWQWGYVGELGPELSTSYLGPAGGTLTAQADNFSAALRKASAEADRRFGAVEKRLEQTEQKFASDNAVHRIAREHAASAAKGTFEAVRKAMPGFIDKA